VVRLAARATACFAIALAPGRPPAHAAANEADATIAEAKPDLAPINLLESTGEWAELFSALAEKQPLFSTFTEARRFPFKKAVVKLRGEMRFSRDLGLSLHYEEPESRTLIVDEKGIVMRDGRGRSRSFRGDRRGAPAPVVLLPVMSFDLPKIAGNFEVRGASAGEMWWLEFLPRDEALGTRVEAIQVAGEGSEVKHIAFNQESGQQVQIIIESTRTGVAFSKDDVRRWFR